MKLRKLGKQGVLGLETAKAFVLSILGIAVIAMAVLITLNALDSTSVATNATKNITANISQGVSDFFKNSTTWFALLSLVIIILIIAIVIVAVNRFGARSGEGL